MQKTAASPDCEGAVSPAAKHKANVYVDEKHCWRGHTPLSVFAKVLRRVAWCSVEHVRSVAVKVGGACSVATEASRRRKAVRVQLPRSLAVHMCAV